MSEPRWLSADEQVHWRAWIAASTLLQDRLGRELNAEHGLTMADYEILVRLSDAQGHQLRMSDLAEQSLSSRSRLSHQINRMEEAGLVKREVCATDRRGFLAVLTEHGWNTLVSAAPTHVEGVQQHLLDQLTAEEFAALGAACAKVAAHLQSIKIPCEEPAS